MTDQTEPKKKRKMTLKQRKWLRLYVESGNATQAALEAYGLDEKTQYDTAKVIGSTNITKLNFPIEELMEESGLTDVYLIGKLRENLNATKPFGKNAMIHDDFSSRNKALETALKVKGKLTDRVDLTTKGKPLPTPIYNGLSTKK